MDNSRSSLFQTLKPICIALSQEALDFQAGKSTSSKLVTRLQVLVNTLGDVNNRSRGVQLDTKLAEYIFFPLSHIFRQPKSVPTPAVEVALECLLHLLETGWRSKIAPELAIQLLIMLTSFSNKEDDKMKRQNAAEDLQPIAFRCLAAVIRSATSDTAAKGEFLKTQHIPAIGMMVTVTLDGVAKSSSSNCSLQALIALQAFVQGVADRDILASFLPGIVSSLTQVLTPSTKTRRPYNLLVVGLDVVTLLLRLVIADSHEVLPKTDDSPKSDDDLLTTKLDESWLKATTAQLKLAIANILRLRTHERQEVRNALRELCIVVLDECSRNMSNSCPMALETILFLAQNADTNETSEELQALMSSKPAMYDLVRSHLYDTLMSMPRIILSNDTDTKTKTCGQVISSLRLLNSTGVELAFIDNTILSSIKDSLMGCLHDQGHTILQTQDDLSVDLSTALVRPHDDSTRSEYPNFLIGGLHGANNITLIQEVLKEATASAGSLEMVEKCLDVARMDNGTSGVTSFWIALNILRERTSSSDLSISSFIEFHDEKDDKQSDLLNEIYSFALSILNGSYSSTDEYNHERSQALALEVLALQAKVSGSEFRVELVDALYPVLHHLGSTSTLLRQHAILTLNSLALSLEYSSARELIVQNVDYLVNGVSAKINTFDIEPQAPRVLLMLVKLVGPRLIPYLDDVVGGIFEALEEFHGYQKLVELLFSSMKGVVDVGVLAPVMAIEGVEEAPTHKKAVTESLSVSNLAAKLQKRREKRNRPDKEVQDGLPIETPHEAWKDLQSHSDEPIDENTADTDDQPPQSDDKSPVTPTYKTLLHIAELTQHHLPSSSPSIRHLLLTLLSTAIPYLSRHEESFLPLINTLWPVLVPRLRDKEAYVVAGVLDVIGLMCQGSGDFMAHRVGETWPEIRRIWHMARHRDSVGNGAARTQKRLPLSSRTPALIMGEGEIASIRKPSSNPSSSIVPATPPEFLSAASTTRPSNASRQEDNTSSNTGIYTPTPLLMLRNALRTFLVRYVTHVRCNACIFAEILGDMLRQDLVQGNEAVCEALRGFNADAVWFVIHGVQVGRTKA